MKSWVFNRIAYFIICHAFISLSSDQAAFAPFLVPNYQTVYIIDYRYFASVDSRGIAQFCTDVKAKDLLFLNNISATRNKDLEEYQGENTPPLLSNKITAGAL